MEKLDFNNQLAKVAMILDKLQVELCEDTPYEIPSANETRERILKAMDELELLEKSHYSTKEMFYMNLRSVNVILKNNGDKVHVPFVSNRATGFHYLKEHGFRDFEYAYVPDINEYDKNGRLYFSIEGFLIPKEFVREYVENH